MGLCRSKHKPGKGEKQKGWTYSFPKPKESSMDRHRNKSAEVFPRKREAAKQQWQSPKLEEKPETKVTSSKRKIVIPQIIITTASNENLVISNRTHEPRTIKEHTEWGPYARHRNPSTIDAYALLTKE